MVGCCELLGLVATWRVMSFYVVVISFDADVVACVVSCHVMQCDVM